MKKRLFITCMLLITLLLGCTTVPFTVGRQKIKLLILWPDSLANTVLPKVHQFSLEIIGEGTDGKQESNTQSILKNEGQLPEIELNLTEGRKVIVVRSMSVEGQLLAIGRASKDIRIKSTANERLTVTMQGVEVQKNAVVAEVSTPKFLPSPTPAPTTSAPVGNQTNTTGGILTIESAPLPEGVVSDIYYHNFNVIGGIPSYEWSLSGDLPSGVSLSQARGELVGTPTQEGTFNFTLSVKDFNGGSGNRSFSLTVKSSDTLRISNTTLSDATVGSAYTATLSKEPGDTVTGNAIWSLSGGVMPEGLELSAAGKISGTPKKEGTYTLNIQVRDIRQQFVQKILTLKINGLNTLAITTKTLPDATMGSAYSQTLTASGGTGTYTWSLLNGTLPNGLSLNATTGVISGTSTQGENVTFTIQLADSTGQTTPQLLSIRSIPLLPTITGFVPDHGSVRETITITGTNFFAPITVFFDGKEGTSVTVKSNTEITAKVPPTTVSGTAGPLKVKTLAGEVTGANFTINKVVGPYEEFNSDTLANRVAPQAIALGNSFFLFGGDTGVMATKDVVLGAIAGDDIGVLALQLAPMQMQVERAEHVCLVIGNYIYCMGGRRSPTDLGLGSTERVLIDDPVAGTLNAAGFANYPVGNMTSGRRGLTGHVLGDFVYLIGGGLTQDGTGALNTIEQASGATAPGNIGAFAVIGPTLATARQDHASAIIGNYIYVFGGRNGTGSLKTVERAPIDIPTSTITASFSAYPTADLSQPRHAHNVLVFDGYVYILGGNLNGGFTTTIERAPIISATGDLGAFEIYSKETVHTRQYPVSTPVGNYFYYMGGLSNSSGGTAIERAPIL